MRMHFSDAQSYRLIFCLDLSCVKCLVKLQKLLLQGIRDIKQWDTIAENNGMKSRGLVIAMFFLLF